MIIKNDIERANLIEGGRRLAGVLTALRTHVAPGVTAEELDDLAERLITEAGDEPCFLGYTPEGGSRLHYTIQFESKVPFLGPVIRAGLETGIRKGLARLR